MIRTKLKIEEMEEVKSLDLAAGRRAFIKSLATGAAGAAMFGAAAGVTPAFAQAMPTPVQVLNFALNLEYLEATFYNYAYYGTDLTAADTTGSDGTPSGSVTGGHKAALTSSLVKAYALELATEELKHVQVLRKKLMQAGAPYVARPALDIGPAFAAAAKAAGINNGGSFNAYANDASFLLAAYVFEDVGVTAYHGAAPALMPTPANPSADLLNYAAGILAVEAYHAGIIRTALFAANKTTYVQDTQLISNLRSSLANGGKIGVDDIGIGNLGSPRLVTVNAPKATMFIDVSGGDAIAYARTVRQVLNIVYGKANATKGLFFPAGINLPGATGGGGED